MSYKNDKIKETADEILSPDEQKISEMLGNLKIVPAPKDFDHRLKARIANASPPGYRPFAFFPVLKYAMPLGLFLLIGGALIWSGGLNINNNSVPSVAETNGPFVPAAVAGPRPEPTSTREIEAQAAETGIDSSSPAKNENALVTKPKTPGRKVEKTSATDISSVDKALKQAPKTIVPKGSETRRLSTAREVLSTIGIGAEFEAKGWKVGSVAKDSPANRSGIRTGDVIEALDGQPLDDKKVFTGGFNAKTVKILRESKTLQIDLKP